MMPNVRNDVTLTYRPTGKLKKRGRWAAMCVIGCCVAKKQNQELLSRTCARLSVGEEGTGGHLAVRVGRR